MTLRNCIAVVVAIFISSSLGWSQGIVEEPTLDQTLKWIAAQGDKMDRIGRRQLREKSYDARWTSFVMKTDGCTVSVRYEFVSASSVEPSESRSVAFDLAELSETPDILEPEKMLYHGSSFRNSTTLKNFWVRLNPASSAQKPFLLNTGPDTSWKHGALSKEMAERFVKAWGHAIKLCKENRAREPF